MINVDMIGNIRTDEGAFNTKEIRKKLKENGVVYVGNLFALRLEKRRGAAPLVKLYMATDKEDILLATDVEFSASWIDELISTAYETRTFISEQHPGLLSPPEKKERTTDETLIEFKRLFALISESPQKRKDLFDEGTEILLDLHPSSSSTDVISRAEKWIKKAGF